MRYAPDAQADHHATMTLRSMLNNGFAEGRDDVLLARKHPQLWSQTLLASNPPGARGLAIQRVTEQLGTDRCVAIADRLEARDHRRAWTRFIQRAWWGRYLAGVASAPGGAHAQARRPATVRGISIPLDGALHLSADEEVAGAELIFTAGGHTLARVPTLTAGAQWDWDDVVDRATDALLAAGVPSAEAEIR